VFESLRRMMSIQNKTLQDLFFVSLTRDQFSGKVMIKRQDFFQRIQSLNIPNLQFIERDLIALL